MAVWETCAPMRRTFTSLCAVALAVAGLLVVPRIGADAAVPNVTVANPAAVKEGTAAAPGKVTFVIQRTGLLGSTTVHWRTAAGTAQPGADFVATSGSASVSPGQPRNVEVTLVGDREAEPDETFKLEYSDNANFTGNTGVSTATIANDDFTVSVGDLSANEGNSGSANAPVEVSISSKRPEATTVKYTSSPGTAAEGTDYQKVSGSVVIPANSLSGTINVPIFGDTIYEDDETFTVTLTEVIPAAEVGIDDAAGTVTIVDNDPPPAVLPKVSIQNGTFAEGDDGTTTAQFVVNLSGATTHSVTVKATTTDGTAKSTGAGADFEARTQTITFAPSTRTAQQETFNVVINGDTLDEANETFTVTLSDATAATINPTGKTATGTISDDDGGPEFSVAPASATEGGKVTFTITLAQQSGQNLTFGVATENDTAAAPADFTAPASGASVTIPSGSTTGTVEIQTAADALDEADETFKLAATLSGSTVRAVGTITDDDATPTLSITDASVAEGNTGTKPVQLTVSLSAASGRVVTVKWGTANGTATAPSDFTAVDATTLTFDAGQTTKTVSVDVKGDTEGEDAEKFNVNIGTPTNATIADGTGVVTITNDDAVLIRADQITTGAGAGAGSHLRVFDKTGASQAPEGFFPYAPGPGVRVARGDLDNDGHDEIVVAPGAGHQALIQAFTSTGALIAQVDAYPGFNGGAFVAVGDVDGDGKGEVITAAGAGGGPHVRTFKLVGTTGTRTFEGAPGFFGAPGEFTGGLTVASADTNGDNADEIILGAASNGQPVVYVWNYNPATNTPTTRANPFLAYTPEFLGGISVAAGDLDGDGKAEIVTGAGRGGGPHVRVFSGTGGGLPGSAFAYDPGFTGGVNVAVGDVDADGTNEIITAAGPGGGPHVRTFNVDMVPQATSFMAYGAFNGGVYVAAGRP